MKRNRKWILCTALLITVLASFAGCGDDIEPENAEGELPLGIEDLKPVEIVYLENIEELGDVSEGFLLWYDTARKTSSGWPCFYKLDESFAEDGMTAYLFCHISGAENPIEAEYLVQGSGTMYLNVTTGWRETNEVVEPREVLAVLQADSRLNDMEQNMVNGSPMIRFYTETADNITVGYVDWSVLLNAPDGALSADAVDEVNHLFEPAVAFGNIGVNNPNGLHCFMHGYYDNVRDLDFKQFLRHFPIESEFEKGERELLEASAPWKNLWHDWTVDDIPVPTHRFVEEDINQILEYCAGITLDDINTETDSEVIHEGNAYYNFVSDYGPGVFYCEYGNKTGETLILCSESYVDEDGKQVRTEVILKETDGRYLIQSRKMIAAE